MADAIDVLEQRGLLEAVTGPGVRDLLRRPAVVYAGFDPSANSLQVGNLVAVLGLAHFQRCGHRVIALVGGATGMIGDPSGASAERQLLDPETVRANAEGIRENLSRFLDFGHPTAPAKLVNNIDWLGRFTFLEFLRDVGKHFRLGAMLGKESVRARLESEGGMSFTEFSYQLLQAYDFLHLFDTEGCRVQVGGSDQWGNITAGSDLVRKLRGEEVFGVTFPIVCDSAGRKFGKSEGNALFLDRRRTSCYQLYQFFIRVTDADVIRFLKLLTFLPQEETAALEREVRERPGERSAQRRLAEELTRMIHGAAGLEEARRASEVLFGGSMDGLSAAELLEVFADVPSAELPRDAVVGRPVADVCAAAGLCASKGEARRLIAGGGLYVNNNRAAGADAAVCAADVVEGSVLVLRSGRKRFHLVKVR